MIEIRLGYLLLTHGMPFKMILILLVCFYSLIYLSFNQLDLPAYENFEKLRNMLLVAIRECSTGFGLA